MNNIFNNNFSKNNINNNIDTTMPTDVEMKKARKEIITNKRKALIDYLQAFLKAEKMPKLKQMMKDRKLKLSKNSVAFTKNDIINELLNYMKPIINSPYFHLLNDKNEMKEILFNQINPIQEESGIDFSNVKLKKEKKPNLSFEIDKPIIKKSTSNEIETLINDIIKKSFKPRVLNSNNSEIDMLINRIKSIIKQMKPSNKIKISKEIKLLIDNINNTNIKGKNKNIDINEIDTLINKIKSIKKEKTNKKIKEPIIDKPFNVDTFEDINDYELLKYRGIYFLRNLETSDIYSIKNDLPFERVGYYDLIKRKINFHEGFEPKKRVIDTKKILSSEDPSQFSFSNMSQEDKTYNEAPQLIENKFTKEKLAKWKKANKEIRDEIMDFIDILGNKKLSPEDRKEVNTLYNEFSMNESIGKDVIHIRNKLNSLIHNSNINPFDETKYNKNKESNNKKKADEFRKNKLMKKVLNAMKQDLIQSKTDKEKALAFRKKADEYKKNKKK